MATTRWRAAPPVLEPDAVPPTTPATVATPTRRFDLQAHRGGLALRPENTLAAFGNAIQLGVSTLELDVHITRDGQAVVTHDHRVGPATCLDTAPATPGDPQFPYVGKLVHELTFAQLRTLDCGSLTPPDQPAQVPVPGARMPLLREVFELVARYHATDVTVNVELKVQAEAPTEAAPREQFVRVVAEQVRAAGMLRQVTIQSFDWGALMLMRRIEPRLPITALTDRHCLYAGGPGGSPWLGGLHLDDFGGDPIEAIRSFGADAFAPVHGFPEHGRVTDAGYQPYVTRELVDRAHRRGIPVIPWTVDDRATMNKLLDDGVDGLITNCPDVLRRVLADRGIAVPRGYPPPFDFQGHRGARDSRPERSLAALRQALGAAEQAARDAAAPAPANLEPAIGYRAVPAGPGVPSSVH